MFGGTSPLAMAPVLRWDCVLFVGLSHACCCDGYFGRLIDMTIIASTWFVSDIHFVAS
jgi:hypothetical protein